MNCCDNCRVETDDLILIKWPGLDTSDQYQDVCKDCGDIFYKIRNDKSVSRDSVRSLIRQFDDRRPKAKLWD